MEKYKLIDRHCSLSILFTLTYINVANANTDAMFYEYLKDTLCSLL